MKGFVSRVFGNWISSHQEGQMKYNSSFGVNKDESYLIQRCQNLLSLNVTSYGNRLRQIYRLWTDSASQLILCNLKRQMG